MRARLWIGLAATLTIVFVAGCKKQRSAPEHESAASDTAAIVPPPERRAPTDAGPRREPARSLPPAVQHGRAPDSNAVARGEVAAGSTRKLGGTGELAPAALADALFRLKPVIQLCYSVDLAKHDAVSGTLVLEFTVSVDGRIHASRARGALAQTDTAECALRALAALQVRPAPVGGDLRYRQAFSLSAVLGAPPRIPWEQSHRESTINPYRR